MWFLLAIQPTRAHLDLVGLVLADVIEICKSFRSDQIELKAKVRSSRQQFDPDHHNLPQGRERLTKTITSDLVELVIADVIDIVSQLDQIDCAKNLKS